MAINCAAPVCRGSWTCQEELPISLRTPSRRRELNASTALSVTV